MDVTDQRPDRVPEEVRPSIDLQIDELILNGFPVSDRRSIGTAVERELGRLLSERGLPAALWQGGDRSSLDGASIEVRPNTRPEVVGVQVGQAVYRGFRNEY